MENMIVEKCACGDDKVFVRFSMRTFSNGARMWDERCENQKCFEPSVRVCTNETYARVCGAVYRGG